MFRNKKNDKEVGEKFASQFVELSEGMIERYCDRVVYFAASGWLRSLASRLNELPDGAPDDDDLGRQKAYVLRDFTDDIKERIQPFQKQLTDHIIRSFGEILEEPELRELIASKVERRMRLEIERIAEAAAYMAGISTSYLRELFSAKT